MHLVFLWKQMRLSLRCGILSYKGTKLIRFLCDCTIDLSSTTPVIISPCTEVNHQEHDFLIPFYKTNDQMVVYYDRIMGRVDQDWKATVQNDYELLQNVKNGLQNHHYTKFHCMGKPFKDEGDYTSGSNAWS